MAGQRKIAATSLVLALAWWPSRVGGCPLDPRRDRRHSPDVAGDRILRGGSEKRARTRYARTPAVAHRRSSNWRIGLRVEAGFVIRFCLHALPIQQQACHAISVLKTEVGQSGGPGAASGPTMTSLLPALMPDLILCMERRTLVILASWSVFCEAMICFSFMADFLFFSDAEGRIHIVQRKGQ
jgi:hypothetical protein